MAINSKQIQNRILYSIIGAAIFLTSIISSICMVPFYKNLRALQNRELIDSLHIVTLTTNTFISRAKETVLQISSRLKTMQALDNYAKGKISYQELQHTASEDLVLTFKKNPHLVSIKRFEYQGQTVVFQGKEIPLLYSSKISNTITVAGPYLHKKNYYILVTAPTYNSERKLIGSDQMIFNFNPVVTAITSNRPSKIDDLLLLRYEDKKLAVLYPPQSNNRPSEITLQNAAQAAILEKKFGKMIGKIGEKQAFIYYSPIESVSWAAVIIAQESNLLIPIKNTLLHICAAILAAMILLIVFLALLLKPLSGKMIFRISELSARIRNAKHKLNIINRKLRYMTLHDSLTEVSNLRGFTIRIQEEFSRARRHNLCFALLYIDFNEFKKINDVYGHNAGDQLLIHFIQLLQKSLRSEDFVARIGGDEFVVILPQTSTIDQIKAIIKKIKKLTVLPLYSLENDRPINYSVSIGYAVYPTDGKNTNTLLKVADFNMYKDKKL